jgi:hypothetical protein
MRTIPLRPAPAGFEWIFTTRVRDPRTGKIRYAWSYGKKAFRILVRKRR